MAREYKIIIMYLQYVKVSADGSEERRERWSRESILDLLTHIFVRPTYSTDSHTQEQSERALYGSLLA